jgi:hypothetical protein
VPDDILLLRQTWPNDPNIFSVLNGDGDTIGRIAYEDHMPRHLPRWHWMLQAFNYRCRPEFSDRCDTREEAMAEVKARWPAYHAEMEYDGWLERVRRERLGVPTRMFVYRDEYEDAPDQIEALAGCLEGTVEEAQLSLLVQALEHQEAHQYPLRIRVTGIEAERDRARWLKPPERVAPVGVEPACASPSPATLSSPPRSNGRKS